MIQYKFTEPTADEWNTLISFTNWSKHPETVFEQAAKNSLFFVTAYYDNKIVGMLQVVGDGVLSFYIQYVIVHSDYRSRGIAREMMNKALNKIQKQADPDAVIALFSSSQNQGLYEKLGFIPRPNDKQGPAMIFKGRY